MVVDGVKHEKIRLLTLFPRKDRRKGRHVFQATSARREHGACRDQKHRKLRSLCHHMRLGKAADDPTWRGQCRASLLGLLAKIKCSICSYQLNIWYAAHWVAHILNWFLELGCGNEACLVPATGCLGIALPPSAAHFPSGKKLLKPKQNTFSLFSAFRYDRVVIVTAWLLRRPNDWCSQPPQCSWLKMCSCSNVAKKWHTYLTREALWSRRQSSQGEAFSLHFDWVDPCDYPKCG